MVFFEGWGLIEVIKKSKILEKSGCGTIFTRLGGCSGDGKEGVHLD